MLSIFHIFQLFLNTYIAYYSKRTGEIIQQSIKLYKHDNYFLSLHLMSIKSMFSLFLFAQKLLKNSPSLVLVQQWCFHRVIEVTGNPQSNRTIVCNFLLKHMRTRNFHNHTGFYRVTWFLQFPLNFFRILLNHFSNMHSINTFLFQCSFIFLKLKQDINKKYQG